MLNLHRINFFHTEEYVIFTNDMYVGWLRMHDLWIFRLRDIVRKC